jgi:hypothetical protein
MLLLVSPPLLAATLYISHGRVATALLHGTKSTTTKDKKDKKRGCCSCCCTCTCTPATTLYILADVIAIFTQLIGTVLPASGTPEAQRLSKIVVLVGLLAQLVALGVFVVLGCGRLHARLRRDPAAAGSAAMVADPSVNWLGYLVVMEVVAGMLIVRSVVRGAEYLEGTTGVVARHEVFVYVFDAVPMLVVMVGFLVLYPARLVREVRRLEEARGKPEGGEATGLVELREV